MPISQHPILTDCVARRAPIPTVSTEFAHIRTWIFDLDNTLYRADVSFFANIGEKMTDFISRHLAMQPSEARQLQEDYLHDYGATLSGLMDIHGMDPAEFLDYVHDVDLSSLAPDPRLRKAIAALPGRKLIFTNGSRGHIKNVATHLNLMDLFDGGFAIEDADYQPKPKRKAYELFNDIFEIEPETAIFFEDTLRNLEVPKQMGMQTVWVNDVLDQPLEFVRTDGSVRKATWVDQVTDNLCDYLESALSGAAKSAV